MCRNVANEQPDHPGSALLHQGDEIIQPPKSQPPHKSRQRGLWVALIVLIVAAVVGAVVLVSLMRTEEPTDESPSAAPVPAGLGTEFEFTRSDTGAKIGTIAVHEVIVVPSDCMIDPIPGTLGLAIQVEIDNVGTVALSTPDMYSTTTLDTAGFTQPTENGVVTLGCQPQWPEGASADIGKKTIQWVVLQVRADPVALQYTPIVASEDASLENWEFVKPSPLSVKIALPSPLPTAAPISLPTSTTTPIETVAPTVAPPTRTPEATTATPAAGVACDPAVDNWATGADGGQLKCTYAGGPTPKWVNSSPFIGIRQPGSPCSYDDGVAESPSGQTLMCTGPRDSAVWMPGP